MKQLKQGFTLVELIVVVSILAILSTIGFVSYSGYITGVRDTNRINQISSLYNGLELYRVKRDLPIPEDKVDIEASGSLIAYQGYLGKSNLEMIEYSKEGKDPKDDTYFSYYLTADKKYFQLLALLEDELEEISFIPQTYASVDYTNRYSYVLGEKLGILTDEDNTPVQEVGSIQTAGQIELDGTDQNTKFIAHRDEETSYAFSGSILAGKLYALSKPKTYASPKSCPDGFISVPGDSSFNQKGFCVAQYEMTYSDADTPNSTGGGTDRNTIHYDPGKEVVSMSGKYPIADITQGQAISACMSMGAGYHLITNNEWMTIARNIEMEGVNWSSGTSGEGYIPNGVSNNTSLGCNRTGGNTETRNYATKTGPGSDIDCNARRSHTLSNGQVIWDFSGNVWGHVNKANTLDGSDYDTGTNPDILTTNNARGEWSSASQVDREAYGPLIGVDSNNGIGRVYQADGTVFLRGAPAGAAGSAGGFALRLGWSASSQTRTIGFRCAY